MSVNHSTCSPVDTSGWESGDFHSPFCSSLKSLHSYVQHVVMCLQVPFSSPTLFSQTSPKPWCRLSFSSSYVFSQSFILTHAIALCSWHLQTLSSWNTSGHVRLRLKWMIHTILLVFHYDLYILPLKPVTTYLQVLLIPSYFHSLETSALDLDRGASCLSSRLFLSYHNLLARSPFVTTFPVLWGLQKAQ